VQIISSIDSSQPYLFSPAAPFLNMRRRRHPLSVLRCRPVDTGPRRCRCMLRRRYMLLNLFF